MRNIISIDIEEDYFDVKVQLCKRNRTPIDNLNSIYNKKLHVKLGNVHELSFSIPYYISRNHKMIENPLINKMKLGFLVHLEFKNHREYFIIMDNSKSVNSSGDTITYNLKSLAYHLSKFTVFMDVTSYTLSQIMLGTTFIDDDGEEVKVNGILSETNWTLGEVDVEFDMLYRSYSVTTSTVLQAIFEVAEKFGAMPRFDTVNRKVDFIQLESSGINRGYRGKEGINLETWGVDTTLEDIVTRLKCYGQDGLEFRSLSVNGGNTIEDYSYFMYPFECDTNYNVIKSSDYMTDDLCIALTKYKQLTDSLQGQFNNLVLQKTNQEDNKVQREKELSDLETELKNLNHELDLINLTYLDQADDRQDWQNLQPLLDAKEIQVQNKKNEISQIEAQISALESQIRSLQLTLATERNFTEAQVDELKDYVYVKEFSDSSIAYEKDLLEAGAKAFLKYREPQVTIKFSIANFIKDMNLQVDKTKINLGDIATFESKRLGIEIQTRITEIEYDLDELNHTITISNDINKNTDEDLLADLLSKVSTTALTLDAKLYTIDQSKHTGTMVDQLLNNAFDTGKQHLLGGFESTNEMTERGFYSRSIHNPTMDFLVINGGAIYWTNDGARKVNVAIDSTGVYADKLIGRLILSNKLMIDSLSGIMTLEDGLLTIKDVNMIDRIQLGRYQDPKNPSNYKYGLNILNGQFNINTSDNPNRGVEFDDMGLRTFNNNGVQTFSVNAVTGEVTIIGSLSIKSSHDSNKGIVIDSSGLRGYRSNGSLGFQITNEGDIWFAGRLESATGTVSNLGGTVNNIGGTVNNISGTVSALEGRFEGVFAGTAEITNGTFGGVVTGSLSAQTINSIEISADQIEADTVSALKIDVNQLRANGATVDKLSAISSDLGNITSAQIDIDDDLYVGNNIYLGSHNANQQKSIIFNNSAKIVGGGGTVDADMTITSSALFIRSENIKVIGTTIDFSGINVIGL